MSEINPFQLYFNMSYKQIKALVDRNDNYIPLFNRLHGKSFVFNVINNRLTVEQIKKEYDKMIKRNLGGLRWH
jgi:hypothetical protein